ncbi:GNAT family N-acetyltransferase [Alteromonas lipolytica]|uniref:GNAT family N-acetyltransferase n=1 Tax=Alteromonas lipolytica TaxID=1856405 RepID=A0A1E8FIH7_9ALTE|nr:GNAT family N-acetyltransferase [Alteromonas lipolytica]OFI35735.1 GNAT family N-acetyltransferase [Alteromonas lipolytica]GGF80331.1 N-acetyltransferase [Alteromonas lipolytica]
MSDIEFTFREVPPAAADFAALRKQVGWKSPELPILQLSIESSLFWVTVYAGNQLIGTGRVVGDGAMYFYIQDVIVLPAVQGGGLGLQIMQRIQAYLAQACQPGTTVALLAAQGKEPFYAKLGFTARDGQSLGLGMCKFI